MSELGLLSCSRNDIVHGLTRQRLFSFRYKQPWKCILSQSQPAADRSQFIPCNGLLDAEAILQARYPQARLVEVHIGAAKRNRLRDTQPMPEQQQKQKVIPNTMAAPFGSLQQPVNFCLSQKVSTAPMSVRRVAILTTLYILRTL